MKSFLQTIISTLTIIKKGNFLRLDGLNKILRSPKNKTLIIMGNGRSLGDDLNSVSMERDSKFSVVNAHVFSDSYTLLKPSYYTLMDRYFLDNERGHTIVQKINEMTTWKMYLLIPHKKEWINIITQQITNEKIRVITLNSFPPSGYAWFKNLVYSRNLGMPRTQNVISAAIYSGISANFSTIKLYGVEHSWLRQLSVNDQNQICIIDDHFYDKKKNEVKTFGGEKCKHLKFHNVINLFSQMFEAYWELQRYAKTRGVKIINHTKGSFIDAFEKVENQ